MISERFARVIGLLYYEIKPCLPRQAVLALRRIITAWKLKTHRRTWPIAEGSAAQPDSWNGWPDGKAFALVLTHDVESEKGRDRCLKLAGLERKRGFKSSFNFVPKRYDLDGDLRHRLEELSCEVGVHGLYHDGRLFRSRKIFSERAREINEYLRKWGASGFRSPLMHRNLDWIHDLQIEYDSSTFDTDPFEPQPDGAGTVFPFLVEKPDCRSYVELPYTMPQDFTLFILMKEKSLSIWRRKLDWLASVGGMVMVNTHPDYMALDGKPPAREEYPASLYLDLLSYIEDRYQGQYWHATPLEAARYFRGSRQPCSPSEEGPEHRLSCRQDENAEACFQGSARN